MLLSLNRAATFWFVCSGYVTGVLLAGVGGEGVGHGMHVLFSLEWRVIGRKIARLGECCGSDSWGRRGESGRRERVERVRVDEKHK